MSDNPLRKLISPIGGWARDDKSQKWTAVAEHIKQRGREFFSISFDPDSGGFILVTEDGFAVPKSEFEALVEGFEKFYSSMTDKEIQAINRYLLEQDMRERLIGAPAMKKPAKKDPQQGWIYFVKGNGLYKVGKTGRKPDARVTEFSPKLPFEASIDFAFYVDDYHEVERRLHDFLSPYHKRGEWFDIPQAVISEIKNAFSVEGSPV